MLVYTLEQYLKIQGYQNAGVSIRGEFRYSNQSSDVATEFHFMCKHKNKCVISSSVSFYSQFDIVVGDILFYDEKMPVKIRSVENVESDVRNKKLDNLC